MKLYAGLDMSLKQTSISVVDQVGADLCEGVIAAVLLPPIVVSGVLSINLEVVPGGNHPGASAVVCGILLGATAIQFWPKFSKWVSQVGNDGSTRRFPRQIRP